MASSNPTTPARQSTNATAAGGGAASTNTHYAAVPPARSFFEKERERLVSEIAEGVGLIIDRTNVLNRKLEESITVGREFEPIAALWGRFAELMTAAGVPDLSAAAASGAQGAGGTAGVGGENEEVAALARSRGAGGALPPGVAPGGGLVYGRDA